jgi:Spy/CpxP family protein refolding chaperone
VIVIDITIKKVGAPLLGLAACLFLAAGSVHAADNVRVLALEPVESDDQTVIDDVVGLIAMGPAGDCGGPGMPPPPFGGGPGGHGGPPPFGPPGGPGHGPMMIGLPLHDVDLTDDQVEKLAAIRSGAREKADPIMLKMHSLEHEFINALAQSSVNSDDVTRIRTQLSAQKQSLDAIFTDSAVASAQLLTPEQRKQIKLQMSRHELGPLKHQVQAK